jgi:hypothetical protein
VLVKNRTPSCTVIEYVNPESYIPRDEKLAPNPVIEDVCI